VAKSSAEYYEVRWRVSGSDESWSAPQRVAPAHEIVVEDLDRTKTYEFEVRAVSACGAKSDWVSGTHTVPDVPAGNLRLDDIKTEVDNAAADALAANQELANIASDNILSQGEKPVVIRDTNVITTEQAGIDAQATAFGVTTEKTAYDSAVTALTAYLATLTTPVLWSDLSGDTTIVGTTFRSKFADVYTTRQALLNAIYAAAKVSIDNSAPAHIINPGFDKDLWGWVAENDAAHWRTEQGTNGPNSGTTYYAVYTCNGTTSYLRNKGTIPVAKGQIVKLTCKVRGISSPNGTPSVRIVWQDGTYSDIGSKVTSGAIGNVTQTLTVQDVAPADGVAVASIGSGGSSGYHNFDDVAWTYQPGDIDELPGSNLRLGENLLANGDFEQGSAYWKFGGIGGVYSNSALAYSGNYRMELANTNGTQFSYAVPVKSDGATIDAVPVTPGETVVVAGYVYTPGGNATCGIGIIYRDASGAESVTPGFLDLGIPQPYKQFTFVHTVPAGAVSAYIRPQTQPNGSVTTYVRWDQLVFSRAKGLLLTTPGSGTKVGNQFNNPNSLTLNYGAVRSTTALSATSAGAVSVSAFTYYAGSASVPYNAVSNAVTGLSQGSTYFIYCHDQVPTGGTKTWLATTNVNALLQTYDDIVVAGQVTIPTSGSSGGGGGGLCVCDDMLVAEGRHAGAAEEGDLFDCMDLPRRGLEKFQRALQSVERSAVECVRLTTEHGAIWEGSASTPFDLIEGGVEWAPRMKGRQVVTDFGIEAVVRVEHIGVRPVSHLHFGGCSYAAGRDARHRVYSHNLQWKP
jgi:hypothetical protein